MKILIVEDDRFYAQRITEQLVDRGVETSTVSSAEEALQLSVDGFDAAIIDVMLPNDPKLSGISLEEARGGFATGVCVARRLLAKQKALQIILLTSGFNPEVETWASSNGVPLVSKSDGYHALLSVLTKKALLSGDSSPLAFIVHGHDDQALLDLKNYLQNTLKWREPIILREQPSSGKTVIEKFEDYASRIDCVFVLLTPDDTVRGSASNEERRRSRQNVIFEAGFFYGKLERTTGRVFLLHKGETEIPSDISGVIYIDISNGIAAAGENIRLETAFLTSTAAS